MGFEKSHLLGKVSVDFASTGAGTFTIETDIPGSTLTQKFAFTIPAGSRRTIASRLPGTMQGHLLRVTITPASDAQFELYGIGIWSRELPTGAWGWWRVPVVDTPPEYGELAIPMVPTPTEFGEVGVPIDPTPATFGPIPIPMVPTPAEFGEIGVPIDGTSATFRPIPIPIDATPETFRGLSIGIETTPESFSLFKLPVKITPPVPDWVSVEVDE